MKLSQSIESDTDTDEEDSEVIDKKTEHLDSALAEAKEKLATLESEVVEFFSDINPNIFFEVLHNKVSSKNKKESGLERLNSYASVPPRSQLSGFDFTQPWHASPPVDYFVERSNVIKALDEKLKSKSTFGRVVVCAYSGLEGIGKTQSVSYYFHKAVEEKRYRGGYFWFEGKNPESLKRSYIELGQDLGCLPVVSGAQDVAWQHMRLWLQTNPGWLAVYDNAPDDETLKPFLPEKGGSIIIATCNANLAKRSGSDRIVIPLLTNKEAISLVNSLLKRGSNEASFGTNEDILALAKKLGHLPLALVQASTYIDQTNKTISQYLVDYEKRKLELLNDPTLPLEDKHNPVYPTITMNFEILQTTCPEALVLLECWGCLAPKRLPYMFMKQLVSIQLHNGLEEENNKKYDEVIRQLKCYSLITLEKDQSYSLHNLTYDILKAMTANKEMQSSRLQRLAILLSNEEKERDLTTADIQQRQCLIPHLEALQVHFQAHFQLKDSYELADSKIINSYLQILDALDSVYFVMGQARLKKVIAEEALKISRMRYGAMHYLTARMCSNLGDAYSFLGKDMQAIELYEEALFIIQVQYRKNPSMVRTLVNLGHAYRALGNCLVAKELYEEAFYFFEYFYGKRYIETAIICSNLGAVYLDLGDYTQAQKLFEKALNIKKEQCSERHIEIARIRSNLGTVYQALGSYADAKKLFKQALVIKRKQYGEVHVETAITLLNLCVIYGELNKFTKQKILLNKLLVIFKQQYGEQHHFVGITLHYLACAEGGLGNLEEKETLLERALDVKKQSYENQECYEIARTLRELGRMQIVSKQWEESASKLSQALSMQVAHYGDSHPEVSKTKQYQAEWFLAQGKKDKALSLAKEAYSNVCKYQGFNENHPIAKALHQFINQEKLKQGCDHSYLFDSVEEDISNGNLDNAKDKLIKVLKDLDEQHGVLHQISRSNLTLIISYYGKLFVNRKDYGQAENFKQHLKNIINKLKSNNVSKYEAVNYTGLYEEFLEQWIKPRKKQVSSQMALADKASKFDLLETIDITHIKDTDLVEMLKVKKYFESVIDNLLKCAQISFLKNIHKYITRHSSGDKFEQGDFKSISSGGEKVKSCLFSKETLQDNEEKDTSTVENKTKYYNKKSEDNKGNCVSNKVDLSDAFERCAWANILCIQSNSSQEKTKQVNFLMNLIIAYDIFFKIEYQCLERYFKEISVHRNDSFEKIKKLTELLEVSAYLIGFTSECEDENFNLKIKKEMYNIAEGNYKDLKEILSFKGLGATVSDLLGKDNATWIGKKINCFLKNTYYFKMLRRNKKLPQKLTNLFIEKPKLKFSFHEHNSVFYEKLKKLRLELKDIKDQRFLETLEVKKDGLDIIKNELTSVMAKIDGFINELISKVFDMIDEPLCKYSICVSGSLGNQVFSLYSGVSIIIIVEVKNNDNGYNTSYFQLFTMLLRYLFLSLGESRKITSDSRVRYGFHLNDRENLSFSKYTTETSDLIILTSLIESLSPECLITKWHPLFSLMDNRFLRGDETLFNNFKKRMTKELNGTFAQGKKRCHYLASQLIGSQLLYDPSSYDFSEINQNADFMKIETAEIYNVEKLIGNIIHIIKSLAIYFGINEASIFERLDTLGNDKGLDDKLVVSFKRAILFLYFLQLDVNFHYACKKEKIYLKSFSEEKNVYVLGKPKRTYLETLIFYIIKPAMKALENFMNENEKETRKQIEDLKKIIEENKNKSKTRQQEEALKRFIEENKSKIRQRKEAVEKIINEKEYSNLRAYFELKNNSFELMWIIEEFSQGEYSDDFKGILSFISPIFYLEKDKIKKYEEKIEVFLKLLEHIKYIANNILSFKHKGEKDPLLKGFKLSCDKLNELNKRLCELGNDADNDNEEKEKEISKKYCAIEKHLQALIPILLASDSQKEYHEKYFECLPLVSNTIGRGDNYHSKSEREGSKLYLYQSDTLPAIYKLREYYCKTITDSESYYCGDDCNKIEKLKYHIKCIIASDGFSLRLYDVDCEWKSLKEELFCETSVASDENSQQKMRKEVTSNNTIYVSYYDFVKRKKQNYRLIKDITSKILVDGKIVDKKNEPLIDEHGLIVSGITPDAKHPVREITAKSKSFYFKFYPENPFVEFLISRHSLRFLGGGVINNCVVGFTYGPEATYVPVLITEKVSGESLKEVIKPNKYREESCDSASSSQNESTIPSIPYVRPLMRVLLTNPEDDSIKDYFLLEENTEKELIRIDNERSFVCPQITEKLSVKNIVSVKYVRSKPNVKSFILCMDELKESISADENLVIRNFLRIDIWKTFCALVQELKEYSILLSELFSMDDVKELLVKNRDREILCLLRVAVPIEKIINLVGSRGFLLQECFRLTESSKNKITITGNELFSLIYPDIFPCYSKINSGPNNLFERQQVIFNNKQNDDNNELNPVFESMAPSEKVLSSLVDSSEKQLEIEFGSDGIVEKITNAIQAQYEDKSDSLLHNVEDRFNAQYEQFQEIIANIEKNESIEIPNFTNLQPLFRWLVYKSHVEKSENIEERLEMMAKISFLKLNFLKLNFSKSLTLKNILLLKSILRHSAGTLKSLKILGGLSDVISVINNKDGHLEYLCVEIPNDMKDHVGDYSIQLNNLHSLNEMKINDNKTGFLKSIIVYKLQFLVLENCRALSNITIAEGELNLTIIDDEITDIELADIIDKFITPKNRIKTLRFSGDMRGIRFRKIKEEYPAINIIEKLKKKDQENGEAYDEVLDGLENLYKKMNREAKQELSFSKNKVIGKCLSYCKSFLTKAHLEYLNLSSCLLDNKHIKIICEIYSKQKNCGLKSLILENDQITSAGDKELANLLEHNNSITYLSLARNYKSSCTGAYALASMLENNSTLQHLNLRTNFCPYLADVSVIDKFSEVLTKNTTLTTLNLSGNFIDQNKTQAFINNLNKDVYSTLLGVSLPFDHSNKTYYHPKVASNKNAYQEVIQHNCLLFD